MDGVYCFQASNIDNNFIESVLAKSIYKSSKSRQDSCNSNSQILYLHYGTLFH